MLHRLTITLRQVNRGTHETLKGDLSKLVGITAPAVDMSTRQLEMLYHPRFVSAKTILEAVRARGYDWENVTDVDSPSVLERGRAAFFAVLSRIGRTITHRRG
jgi:hypothetical protein